MKVALILASNTCYAPHIYHYKRLLQEKNIDFDIVIWNKDSITEKGCISYDCNADLGRHRIFRLKDYFAYAKFVINVLKKGKYDRIVVFTIFLGVLLYPFLKKHCKKIFIFDIRDFSPVLNSCSWIIKSLIKDSFTTVISSPGFLNWLPRDQKYSISHNYHFDEKLLLAEKDSNQSSKFVILTIGFLRDFEINKSVIDALKNDSRFVLKFVGRGIAYVPLMNYVKINEINNVVFVGEYDKKDENGYLENVGLMNIFLDRDINSRTLMTNRFYLAVSNQIPVLVNSNSVQGNYVGKFGLGLQLENCDTLKDDLLLYLQNYNKEVFLDGREKFLTEIEEDQKVFEGKLNIFLNSEKFVEKSL